MIGGSRTAVTFNATETNYKSMYPNRYPNRRTTTQMQPRTLPQHRQRLPEMTPQQERWVPPWVQQSGLESCTRLHGQSNDIDSTSDIDSKSFSTK